MQKHIGVEKILVAEKPVSTVTPVFKIGFILCITGGVVAVTATDKHNRKPVFRRHPHNALMTVDESVFTFGKFCREFAVSAHFHQLKIRSAKALKNRISLNAFKQRLSAESLSFGIYQINFTVFYWQILVILKICTVSLH